MLADLAKGPLRGKRAQLAEALDGLFDSHHGMITQMLRHTRIVMLMVPMGPESGFRDCTARPRLLG